MNILTLEKITKIYTQRKLFDEASFYMQDDEKVGIVGINGTGKSTLLKICAGIEEPDSGNVTRASDQVIGYLPQHPEFEKDTDIITCVCGKDADTDRIVRAKTMLSELGFSDFTEKADHMSGGQQKRLALVSVLMDSCDLLLLDEPTNHLDLEMSDWLEDILRRRKGAMIMITHDRYFLDRTVNRIFAFQPDGTLRQYEGGYTDYAAAVREESAGSNSDRKATRNQLLVETTDAGTSESKCMEDNDVKLSGRDLYKAQNAANKKLKMSYQEQKDYETIEDDIAKAEAEVKRLDEQIVLNACDFPKLSELSKKRDETQKSVDELTERWMYLEDLQEKIDSQE